MQMAYLFFAKRLLALRSRRLVHAVQSQTNLHGIEPTATTTAEVSLKLKDGTLVNQQLLVTSTPLTNGDIVGKK